MSHIDDLALDAKIGLARKSVIEAAYAWRTKADPHEWTAACQTLMDAVDGLSDLMRERHPPGDPMRTAPPGPDSWPV
jgi:hypothetical protein